MPWKLSVGFIHGKIGKAACLNSNLTFFGVVKRATHMALTATFNYKELTTGFRIPNGCYNRVMGNKIQPCQQIQQLSLMS